MGAGVQQALPGGSAGSWTYLCPLALPRHGLRLGEILGLGAAGPCRPLLGRDRMGWGSLPSGVRQGNR